MKQDIRKTAEIICASATGISTLAGRTNTRCSCGMMRADLFDNADALNDWCRP